MVPFLEYGAVIHPHFSLPCLLMLGKQIPGKQMEELVQQILGHPTQMLHFNWANRRETNH